MIVALMELSIRYALASDFNKCSYNIYDITLIIYQAKNATLLADIGESAPRHVKLKY
jgi:hypothetical protein